MTEAHSTPDDRVSELEAIAELPLDDRLGALVEAEAALRDELGRSSGEGTGG